MPEDLRFQLEMRRMEIKKKEDKRREVETRQLEVQRLEIQLEVEVRTDSREHERRASEAIRKVDERKEAIQLELRRLQIEMEKKSVKDIELE